MLLTAQVLISLFILVADADFLTGKSMQELRDATFMDRLYQKTSLSRNRRDSEDTADIRRRLKDCCTVKCADYEKIEEQAAKECEDDLLRLLHGVKKNVELARRDYPDAVDLCIGLCIDIRRNRGPGDNEVIIHKDAALQYVLSMYESKVEELVRRVFEPCLKMGANSNWLTVIFDGSIKCPTAFREIFRCVRELMVLNCPEEAEVESEGCEKAREELKEAGK